MAAPGMVNCPNCKLENKRGDPRCTGCGNALPRFFPSARPATPAASTTRPAAKDPEAERKVPERKGSEDTQAVDAGAVRRLLDQGPKTAPERARVAEPPRAVENAVAWLHCEPLPPIPLAVGQELTIGRRSCALVLAHTEVSRHHATIKVASADQIVISDTGSSNGTFVNGKRIQSQPIRVGDGIKIGPYAIELWAVKDLPAEDPDMTSAVPLVEQATFSGKIGFLTLKEVLAAIHVRQRTGVLEVTDRQQRGTMSFLEGKLQSAEWGPLRGDKALKAMLELTFGSFAFASE